MTESEAIQELMDIKTLYYENRDVEMAHIEADRILLEFLETNGHEKVASAFVIQRDLIGFWYA